MLNITYYWSNRTYVIIMTYGVYYYSIWSQCACVIWHKASRRWCLQRDGLSSEYPGQMSIKTHNMAPNSN